MPYRVNTGIVWKNNRKQKDSDAEEYAKINCICPNCKGNNEYELFIFANKKDKNGEPFRPVAVTQFMQKTEFNNNSNGSKKD